MASRLVLYLTLLAVSAFVVMVTVADAAEEEAENKGLLREVERRSLSEILLEKRAVPDATQEGGRRGNGKKKGRKGKRKGKGKGRGRGKGTPKYASKLNSYFKSIILWSLRYI